MHGRLPLIGSVSKYVAKTSDHALTFGEGVDVSLREVTLRLDADVHGKHLRQSLALSDVDISIVATVSLQTNGYRIATKTVTRAPYDKDIDSKIQSILS